MENKILTEKQKLMIDKLPDEILTHFYLTGGTALSAFYVEHRLSRDMDFNQEEMKRFIINEASRCVQARRY